MKAASGWCVCLRVWVPRCQRGNCRRHSGASQATSPGIYRCWSPQGSSVSSGSGGFTSSACGRTASTNPSLPPSYGCRITPACWPVTWHVCSTRRGLCALPPQATWRQSRAPTRCQRVRRRAREGPSDGLSGRPGQRTVPSSAQTRLKWRATVSRASGSPSQPPAPGWRGCPAG